METKLARLLENDAVPMEKLHEQYGAMLKLVEKLIGVIPNCDPYLEIWPPAFRTYNVLVPNFLNLPFALWGVGAPKEVIGLAMYVASRRAECAYCSAHTASFALRRGTRPEKVERALENTPDVHTAAERAAMAVAGSLARVPCTLTGAEREELLRHYTPDQAEWIVLSTSMMGFLNKFMDALGVDLEARTVNEVRGLISASGWSPGKHRNPDNPMVDTAPPRADTLASKLSILPLIPSALSHDRRWTAGVPKRWPTVGEYLRHHVGSDFPVLSRILQGRAIRAIAVMLRDNVDPRTSVLGIPIKVMAGIIYASVVGNSALAAEVRKMATHHRVLPEQLDEAVRFAQSGDSSTLSVNARTKATLVLARAASPSPSQISSRVIEECQSAALSSPAIVELITWISVLQMLHRLSAFYLPN